MIVLDASATIEWLLRLPLARSVEARMLDADSLHVPHLWFVEVTHVLRRHVHAGRLPADAGGRARTAAEDLPAMRYAHEPLGPRVWQLRDSLSAYDAVYVALAEVLGAALVTTDTRLAAAHGHTATVDLVV